MQEGQQADVNVEIAPALRGRVSLLEVIGPKCTGYLVANYTGLTAGHLISVQGFDYNLQLRLSDDFVELVRDDKQARVPLANAAKRFGDFILNFLWEPQSLLLAINDKEGQRQDKCSTPPTFPPQAIREWARRKALAPNVTYKSGTILYEEVLHQLQNLRDKIIDINAINGFWNIEYKGKKIVSRKPKHETDIHPQIRLLLYDLEVQKGLQVTPEYPTGSGRLDFLISGRTSADTSINVCVEFKLAHAKDLAHGIQVQLPEYMTRRATDYGVYCVLDFGRKYPAHMSKFDIKGFDSTKASLELILPIAASHTGRPYLKTVVIDVSKKAGPSKT